MKQTYSVAMDLTERPSKPQYIVTKALTIKEVQMMICPLTLNSVNIIVICC